MGAVAVPSRRQAAAPGLLTAGGFAALALAMLAGQRAGMAAAGGALVLLLAAVVVKRPYLHWQHILGLLVLVILLIPLRRYKLPGDAGFSLEPYRLLVAVILAGWAAALLVDARVKLRRSGLELPIALVILTAMASILANPGRSAALQPTVLKAITFLASFAVVFYLVVSVVRTRAILDSVVKTLVAGGAVVGVLAVIESRTGLTPFTHLDAVFPILLTDPSFETGLDRGSATRAVGSAEHPIALGAALAMLLPLAIYLARTASTRWMIALVPLAMGVVATVSRTGIIMLLIVGLVFLWLRPRETRRLWPVLVPLIVLTQFAAPGALASLKQSFMPEGGLLAQQQSGAGDCLSGGRVADIGPTLAEVGRKPFFGYGYGTRIVTGPTPNACILDNQWLGTLYEVGIAGFVAWMLLFLRVMRRFGRAAKEDDSATGWLLVAVTAAVTAFAVGMLTYDALGFSQVTFLLFIVLGLGAAAAANARRPPPLRAVS